MNIIELAKQAEEYANNIVQSNDNDYAWGFLRDQKFANLVAAARADERGRMCEQCKECLNEKSTSNEANSPAFLGEGKQAN
jgi:hypothetical protein